MENYQSLSHTRWQCKYHIIFIPKFRRKRLFGVLRKEIGSVFRRLDEQKGCSIEEGHVMSDHVHMLISIPPKLSVSSVVGYIKGKSAIHVARHFLKRERNYAGHRLWARGFFVDTVGRDTETIRKYIRDQEQEDQRLDQLDLALENQETNEI
ncbi:IS200/IS605 family transposase [Verrucomicrobia bacterium]|nr:IS200/IS605 family transposase [Verrucomicrobiota bacterium]